MIEEQIQKFKSYRAKILAYNYAMYVISFDSNTVCAPGSFDSRSEHLATLSDEYYQVSTSKEYKDCVYALFDSLDEIEDKDLAFEIKKQKKEFDRFNKIPKDVYVGYKTLLSKSENLWAQAKQEENLDKIMPVLGELIEYKKKMIGYLKDKEACNYDVLLDEYESHSTTKMYDAFFSQVKEKLVPFAKKVAAKKLQYNRDFLEYEYMADAQKQFCDYIEEVMCYEHNYGTSHTSMHPFTSGFGSTEVRYTNHFYTHDLKSSIYSAVHELGHATYELQVDKKFNNTFLSGGASMAMHESQSRLYENVIGRSSEFWDKHYKILQDIFYEQLSHVSKDDFYKYCNEVELSDIRTEADELTYPIHIIIRYEIEKMIFEDNVPVSKLPEIWNQKYKEYLGLDIKLPSHGILQDVHWFGGDFGYFPTYLLGSAYGSQIFHSMNKDFDVFASLSQGTTKQINEWLKEHVHKYGASKEPADILKLATGEDFNSSYYVDYLIEKYTKIYNL